MKKIKFIPFLFFLVLSESFLSQATFTANSTGDWNIAFGDPGSPWSVSGSDTDGLPDGDDDVVINADVSLPSANCNAGSIVIGAAGNLILNSQSYKLFIDKPNSVITNNGEISGSGIIEIRQNGCTVSGSGIWTTNIYFRINRNTTFDNVNITFDSFFLIRIGGSATINSNSSLIFNSRVFSSSSASRLYNYGTVSFNSNDVFRPPYEDAQTSFVNYSGSTVNYGANSGSSGDFPIPSNGYYNLNISGNADCNGDFTIYENWTNNGTFTSSTAGNTITFNGSSAQNISGSGTSNFKNLDLNNTNGLNLTGGTINIDEILSSTSGTITQNGANLNLTSSSDNNAGAVKISSSSDYSYSSGSFTANRFYNGTSDGWRMVAAPIKSATLADWDDEFIYCGIPAGIGNFPAGMCGGFNSVYLYDESLATPTIDDGLTVVSSLSQNVSNATGTLIYTSSGATTISVTGTPEFDDIAKPITSVNDGWNLVANPYPSTLDWTNGSSGFYDDNSALIDNSRWVYSADAANYLSSTDDIPHTQGFWVKTSSGGNLNYSVSQTISSQANFTKSVNGINHPLRLKVTSDTNSYYDFAYILSGPNYSNDYDQGKDIFKFFSPYPDYVPNIFFLDNQGNQLDRTCINNNQSENLQLQVNVGQFAPGNYTIQFENLKQFMIGSCLQLEDLHNGLITDLRQDSTYTFLSDSNAPNPRFLLHINVDYDILVTNSTCYNDSSASITLKGSNLIGDYFYLTDSSGNLVDSVQATSDTIIFSNLNAGIYNYNTSHSGNCNTSNQNIHITQPDEVIADFSTISDTFFLDTNSNIEIYFRNNSSGSNYFFWDFGDGNYSQNKNTSNVYTTPGLYNVQLIAKSDSIGTCINSINKTIEIIGETLDNNSQINIEDNQILILKDKIFIYDLSIKSINLYNVNGQIIKSYQNNKVINIPSLNNGIYLLELVNNDGSSFIKKFAYTFE